jgi:hypothetical protein
MKNQVYDTTLSGLPLSQPINGGNNWIEFLQDQKIIASINPNGQNLGATMVKSYIKPITPIDNFHGQYYLNRTFNITSENKNLADSKVWLYFLIAKLLFVCPQLYKMHQTRKCLQVWDFPVYNG